MGLSVAFSLSTARTFMVTLHAAVAPLTRWPEQGFAVSSCAAGRTKRSQFVGPQPGRQSWPTCTGHSAAGNTGCAAQNLASGHTPRARNAPCNARGRLGAGQSRRGVA